MKNFSFCQDKMNLNFNYDKLQNNKEKKGKQRTSVDNKNSNNRELVDQRKYLDKKKNKIEKGESEHSYMCPKFKDENELFKEKEKKDNINIINDNNKEKNKNEEKEKIKDYDKKEKELIEKMKLSEEKERIQPEIIINSINEIRLPKELYDISYDILQNQ